MSSLSFSLDWSGVFQNASTIIQGFFPIYIVPIGITLGIGLLGIITGAFTKALKLRG